MENNRAYRQINWDEMYLANEKANALNEDALYYQEERHNDQLAFNFSSIFNHNINKNHSYTGGIAFNATKGMHYKLMKDLLGAQSYTDIDKFSVRDYGFSSSIVQNDLDNPNRKIGEGDRLDTTTTFMYIRKVHG